jgi:hypothetical protein
MLRSTIECVVSLANGRPVGEECVCIPRAKAVDIPKKSETMAEFI